MMARLLILLVKGYRLLFSPWLGSACRFEPTCSSYALEALERYGAGRGTWLTIWRLLRCQPWCQGGIDPVPGRYGPPRPGMFSRLTRATDEESAKTASSSQNIRKSST